MGEVFDTQTLADNDTANPGAPLPVDDHMIVNVYGEYEFQTDFVEYSRVRFGIRNIGNEEPPLADEQFGYEGALHSALGRQFYVDLNVAF